MQGRNSLTDNPNFYDYVKHMTTLSTASLILIVTFVEKINIKPEWGFLFTSSIVLFLLTTISSVMCMLFILSIQRYEHVHVSPKWEKILLMLSLFGSWLFFLGGIVCIAIFAIKNFSA